MRKAKRYKSEAAAAIHETAFGLYEEGIIDKQTMRGFDESCLMPVEDFTPEQIKDIRNHQKVSQTVFAHYLNISLTTVSKWERGEIKPAGPSLKLLNLVKRNGLSSIV
jgi:putative transcriptional regulator